MRLAAHPRGFKRFSSTIVATARDLCGSYDALLLLRDGEWLKVAAHNGPIEVGFEGKRLSRDWITGRSVLDGRCVHVPDILATTDFPENQALNERLGLRSMAALPLVRDGEAVGALTIRRQEVRPFSEHELRLLQTFADEAVVAIQNARLFGEVEAKTAEVEQALEYQTATAEVLAVISRSPEHLKPVLDVIAAVAGHVCEADDSHIYMLTDGAYRIAACINPDDEWVKHLVATPVTVEMRGSVTARAARELRTIHVPDTAADPEHGEGLLKQQARRTVVSVPLVRDGTAVGVITLNRRSVNPFAPPQIELLTTFADQAMIAIENARLFEAVQARTAELSEALEQQTATSEVLKVISRSAFDLPKVLDTLIQSAAQLCCADMGTIRRLQGGTYEVAATYGYNPEARDHVGQYPKVPDRGSVYGRTALEGRTVHIPDVLMDPEFGRPEAQRMLGFRAALGVPLVRGGKQIGVIVLQRVEPGAFTPNRLKRSRRSPTRP